MQQAPQTAAEFGARIQDSFSQIGAFVPSLVGALVILFAGYLLAKLVQRATARVLRRLHLNEALERGGVMHAVERTGASVNPARVVADLTFWLVMFAVLLVAANALGLRSLAEVFGELVGYIPSVIAAVVIVIVGIVLGNFVGGLVQASAGTIHGGPTMARIGRVGVIVIAVFMALQELGVATEIVTTAFASLFGAVALALALSFGLGNRELAGEITRAWYERYTAERDAIQREAALEEAEEEAELSAPPPPRKPRTTPFFGSRGVTPPKGAPAAAAEPAAGPAVGPGGAPSGGPEGAPAV
jgi:hypothetical protein